MEVTCPASSTAARRECSARKLLRQLGKVTLVRCLKLWTEHCPRGYIICTYCTSATYVHTYILYIRSFLCWKSLIIFVLKFLKAILLVRCCTCSAFSYPADWTPCVDKRTYLFGPLVHTIQLVVLHRLEPVAVHLSNAWEGISLDIEQVWKSISLSNPSSSLSSTFCKFDWAENRWWHFRDPLSLLRVGGVVQAITINPNYLACSVWPWWWIICAVVVFWLVTQINACHIGCIWHDH